MTAIVTAKYQKCILSLPDSMFNVLNCYIEFSIVKMNIIKNNYGKHR